MTYTTALLLWLAGSLLVAGLLSLVLERDDDDEVADAQHTIDNVRWPR